LINFDLSTEKNGPFLNESPGFRCGMTGLCDSDNQIESTIRLTWRSIVIA